MSVAISKKCTLCDVEETFSTCAGKAIENEEVLDSRLQKTEYPWRVTARYCWLLGIDYNMVIQSINMPFS